MKIDGIMQLPGWATTLREVINSIIGERYSDLSA